MQQYNYYKMCKYIVKYLSFIYRKPLLYERFNMKLDSYNIGEKIRNLRVKYKLTQEQLAEKSDLSVNFISKLERDKKTNISIDKLLKICSVFEITIPEFLDEKNNISISELSPSTIKLINELRNLNSTKQERLSKSILTIFSELKNKGHD